MVSDQSTAVPRLNILQSAVRVLELLANAPQPLGVNAIARLTDVAPSTCFKILKVLVADDLVDFDSTTKAYSIGSGAIRLARRALDPLSAYPIVHPGFARFAVDHDVSVGLWRIVTDRRMVLVGFAEGPSTIRIHMHVGQRLPALVGAVGRAVAAQLDLPEPQLLQEFERLRWQRPLSFERYYSEVKEAAQLGYAIDDGFFSVGVRTVAVALPDAPGSVCYGITAVMIREGRDATSMEPLAKDLVTLGKWVEKRLIARPAGPVHQALRGIQAAAANAQTSELRRPALKSRRS